MKIELERIRREAVVAELKALSYHLPGGAAGSHEDLNLGFSVFGQRFEHGPSKYVAGVPLILPRRRKLCY